MPQVKTGVPQKKAVRGRGVRPNAELNTIQNKEKIARLRKVCDVCGTPIKLKLPEGTVNFNPFARADKADQMLRKASNWRHESIPKALAEVGPHHIFIRGEENDSDSE